MYYAPPLTSERLYLQDKKRAERDVEDQEMERFRQQYREPDPTRGPRSLVVRMIRHANYDDNLRKRLGLTRKELQSIERWAFAMPEWPTPVN